MRELVNAIVEYFDTAEELAEAFPQGCYLGRAPDRATFPTAVFSVAGGTTDYGTCNETYAEYYLVRFTVRHPNPEKAIDHAEGVDSVFQNAALTMPNDSPLSFQRNGVLTPSAEDEKMWRVDFSYDVWVQRNP